ncbi:Retrovirus-related Pol polyprotein from transposon RE2 [Vitis vinifera]|uniref:Retrovirus-related Pol polyprotein from transposon RE2 n=1 Tax=Vitis vinifera TaxID=29760 RepID=A0A438F4P6_VITVI|nr:Retrovirus-related Pol polyprotein from transposon RE2 [Vitis vinifera]
MTTKSSTFSSVISGSPMITSEKLVGNEIICPGLPLWSFGLWVKVMRITFTQEADIPEAKGLYTNDIQLLYKVASSIVNVRQQDMDLSTYIGQIASLKEEFLTVMPLTTDVGDQRIQIDKFFMVLTLIGLRPDLETVHDQILGSSSVSSLDDVFARLLLVTEVEANVLIAPIAISLATLVIGVISYMGGLSHTAHVTQSSDPQSPQPPSSSTSQGIFLTDSEYDDYLRYQATKSAFVASVAQTGNASACLTHTSSLGPWILDSGASDHISAKGFGFAHPLPSLPLHSILYDWSTGKTIGIGRESQGLYHLTSPSPAVCISTDAPLLIHSRLGHPSLSKFQKMVPSFSSFSSLACESCQLGKHTRVSFPKRLNNRAKSPFELVHTDDKLFARANKMHLLGYSRLQKGYRCYSSETHRYFLSADCLLAHFRFIIAVIVSPFLLLWPRYPSASPAPTLPPSADLPIALQKGWRQAMVDEMAALHSNGTWDLVVLPSASVRLLLSMAAMRSWPLYQLDIKNAFLHGDLAEEVYMEQPPGFVAQGSLEFGMFRSTTDHSVFYHHNSSGQCIYLTKDLGKLKYFLGIEIAQFSSVWFFPKGRGAFRRSWEISATCSKLNYLTITRPDISFPVSVVSQFLQSPCDSHWDAIIRILRYIKSIPGQGVLYENRGHTQVVGYTDAD